MATDSVIKNRAIAGWEIASVVTSCLIVEWFVPFVGRSKVVSAVPVILAVALMTLSHRERGETLKEIGFRFDNLLPALRLLLLPTVIAAVGIALAAWMINRSHFAIAPLRLRFFALPFWALFQQYALQGFINRRAQLLVGSGVMSIALVAIIFSFLHLPNPLLTGLTLIGGIIWAAAYQRIPNVFAVAISHTLVSLVLALTLSQTLFYNLRVGLNYFG